MIVQYIPYTYLIGWSTLDRWYYGVEFGTKRRIANPSNLWTKYFTSSRKVAEMRRVYGEPDVVQIRHTFTTAENAYKWEQKVLHRLCVVGNDRWLNRAVYGQKDFSNDPERIKKIVSTRRKNRNSWHSDDTKKKIGESNIGKMKLTDAEKHRRSKHFTERNLYDFDFINKNKEGRIKRWEKLDEREAQAKRMRDNSLIGQQKRIANIRTPEFRAKKGKTSKENWRLVEEAMRKGHEAYRNDSVRQEENRRRIITMHQKRRGWDNIIVDEKEFDTIVACASYLGKSVKWVRAKIRQGEIITR